ncbi:MAG: 37S ribosomal protein S23 mitochondrial [Bathelium mastoideum]|nr:MAG: 37S ribosomal protein S23 mitochondrial [Bathelium mastoideum]
MRKGAASSPSGKPPAPGERKAMRKRIVLSNTNALEVQGLQKLNPKNIAREDSKCRVLALSDELVDPLRAVEAFKPTQGWNMFRKPSVLWREQSIQMAQIISSLDKRGENEVRRMVLSGEKGSGKTVMLLQAMAVAFLKGWVVINIPDAKDLTDAHTEYAPVPGTSPLQYIQRSYVSNLLAQIAKANATVLSKLEISMKHDLPIPVQSNISLDRFADLGAKDLDLAWPIFRALWDELTGPLRPPILLAADNLNFFMRHSEYLGADLKPIHAHDLLLVRHFVEHLSGAQVLPNGGLVLAATTGSNKPSSSALDLVLRQAEARAKGLTGDAVPQWDPYKPIDERSLKSMADLDVLHVKGLSKDEARGIMDYYAASGMLRQAVDHRLVAEKWALAGGGIIGELERGTLRMRP